MVGIEIPTKVREVVHSICIAELFVKTTIVSKIVDLGARDTSPVASFGSDYIASEGLNRQQPQCTASCTTDTSGVAMYVLHKDLTMIFKLVYTTKQLLAQALPDIDRMGCDTKFASTSTVSGLEDAATLTISSMQVSQDTCRGDVDQFLACRRRTKVQRYQHGLSE